MPKIQLSDFLTTFEYPVHWGDMDAAAHVNNLVYLRWGESARIAYFEKMGVDLSFKNDLPGPILGYQDCKYIFPLTYPDVVIVGIRTTSMSDDRFTLEMAVFSKQHSRLAAISRQEIIPYSYKQLRKVALPEEWIARIKEIEGGDVLK